MSTQTRRQTHSATESVRRRACTAHSPSCTAQKRRLTHSRLCHSTCALASALVVRYPLPLQPLSAVVHLCSLCLSHLGCTALGCSALPLVRSPPHRALHAAKAPLRAQKATSPRNRPSPRLIFYGLARGFIALTLTASPAKLAHEGHDEGSSLRRVGEGVTPCVPSWARGPGAAVSASMRLVIAASCKHNLSCDSKKFVGTSAAHGATVAVAAARVRLVSVES